MKSVLLDFGIIYVLANETDSMSKIGRTSLGTAEGRAIDYSKIHGIQWSVFTQLPTIRITEIETNIHVKLREYQVQTETNAREIPPHDAERVMRSLLIPVQNSKERQRLIREHARLVRQRLNKREEPFKWRRGCDMRDLSLDTIRNAYR
jgi:hypothetical protein